MGKKKKKSLPDGYEKKIYEIKYFELRVKRNDNR